MERQDSVQRFLELIRRSHRGKFKVYIGMSAGVGKTCRMLQEARQLLDAGVDVRIGYIETHGRAGTEALVEGLPLVPRRKLFYKGKELEEMDTQAIVNLREADPKLPAAQFDREIRAVGFRTAGPKGRSPARILRYGPGRGRSCRRQEQHEQQCRRAKSHRGTTFSCRVSCRGAAFRPKRHSPVP